MQRFNIALLPVDPAYAELFARLSRTYFLQINDEYVLGPDALAHVTLCQFKAESSIKARLVYDNFIINERVHDLPVTLEKFHIREGKLVNAGKFIAEYSVIKEPQLENLQIRCADVLQSYGIANLTPVDGYAPHFTLARLSSMPEKIPMPSDLVCPTTLKVRLALGYSTEAGVFSGEL